MASLANQTISSTYDGLIKTSSDNAVPVSGVQALEDGSGNALALSVGRSGNGVSVSGTIESTGYFSVEGTSGNTGGASDRWIGGDGTLGTWFYNVPTGSSHLFGVNNSNILTLNGSGALISGNLAVDTNTLYVDAVSDGVGFGTTNLTVGIANTDTGASVRSVGAIQASRSGNRSLYLNRNTTDGQIISINRDGSEVGAIGAAGSGLTFYTGITERMRIDSSGNIIYNLPSIGGTRDIQFPQFSASNAKTIIRATGTSDFRQHLDILMNTAQADVAPTTVVRIDNGGNVGIGTSPSGAKFHTYTTGTQDNILKIQNGTNAYANQIQFIANNDGGAIYNAISSSTLGGSQHWRISGGTAANTFAVSTGGSERMRIDSSGNVGIGDLPSFVLDVNTTSSRARFKASSGDASIELSSIAGRDFRIDSTSDGAFRIYDEDAASERMRITSGGDLLVGTSDVNGSASNGYDIVAGRHATVRGSVSGATTGTAYTMFDVPNYSVWLVTAFVPAASNSYNETALVHSNVGAVSVSVLVNGGNIQISNSGASIQVTQTSGATQNIAYSAIRIA